MMNVNPLIIHKKVLVVGASGMAGQAFMRELMLLNSNPIGLSRNGPNIYLDPTKEQDRLRLLISRMKPAAIINCSAIVSLDYCENNPLEAFSVNSSIPLVLAESAKDCGAKFLQISTDHYYSGDSNKKHSESSPLTLLNKYAESKRLGELNALSNINSLVLRTNIAGVRGDPSRPTFLEWLTLCITKREKLDLYTDFFTSTLDVTSFVRMALSPEILSFNGILNLASSSVSSKKDFAIQYANALGIRLDWANYTSVNSLSISRAESLGLDSTKAEQLIGKPMPDLITVCNSLARCGDLHSPGR